MQRFLGAAMRLILTCSAVLVLTLVFAGTASAHARLTGSTPSDGQVLSAEPATVTATYGEETSLTSTTFDVSYSATAGSTPRLVAQGKVDVNDRTKVSADLPAGLGDGVYTVKWHTLTEDDNGQADGTFSFTVASGQAPTGPTGRTGNQQEMTPTTAGGTTLPSTGQPDSFWPAGLLAALVLLGAGLGLRRRALR